MKRFRRNPGIDPGTPPDAADAEAPMSLKDPDSKRSNTMRLMGVLVVGLMVVSVLFSVSMVLRGPPSDAIVDSSQRVNILDVQPQKAIGLKDDDSPSSKLQKDKLLDGLLSAGFDESSCISRYQSVFYRKESPHKPSPHLISRLRDYEALHRSCGPYTEGYNKTVGKLKTSQPLESTDCSYLVWISFSGLGNRIVTLASAFLYALLTNRVLLVDPGTDMADLFCDPFPEVTWLLPLDFPLKNQFQSFNQKSPHCYGKILKNSSSIDSAGLKVSEFVYLHLVHDYDDEDKLFFCEENQISLQEVPWLILKTDNYFIPSLFLIPSFEQELNNLFPKKDTVFHLLGRYLFHPSNAVWGLVTRYYNAYLAKADERVGIQVRVFDSRPGPFQYVVDQILSCASKGNVLPDISKGNSSSNLKPKSKAVLVTSLSSWYSEKLRDTYWEHPSATREVIGVFQPSHEEYQKSDKGTHNMKVWAEMYLLSFSDVLITSSWSTFGYVAQGLGGLKAWILYKPENGTAPDPPCQRVMSMEPCFHAPPFYDCKAKRGIDTGAVVPHVRHCEDMSWGLKLVDRDEWD